MFLHSFRTNSLPANIYIDSFIAIWSSLLNKDIHVNARGYKTYSKFWYQGTAPPGVGKNPIIDPTVAICEKVMKENDKFAIGFRAENYHFFNGGTDAVGMYKFRLTSGYQCIHNGEANTIISLGYAVSGVWDRSKHLDIPGRHLDSAYGGSVQWETMISKVRENQKQLHKKAAGNEFANNKKETTEANKIERTNVVACTIGQTTIHQSFWARQEHVHPIGFTLRSSFGYGVKTLSGPCDVCDFWIDVVSPVVYKTFEITLNHLGPQKPVVENHQAAWTINDKQSTYLNHIHKIGEVMQEYCGGRQLLRQAFHKFGYVWACFALQNRLLVQISRAVFKDEQLDITCVLNDVDIYSAITSYVFRYLYGISVIQTEILSKAWREEIIDFRTCFQNNIEYELSSILRVVPFHCIQIEDVAFRLARFQNANNPNSRAYLKMRSFICNLFRQLEEHGFGLCIPIENSNEIFFRKFIFSHLSLTAKTKIKDWWIPPFQFGAQFSTLYAFVKRIVNFSENHSAPGTMVFGTKGNPPEPDLPSCFGKRFSIANATTHGADSKHPEPAKLTARQHAQKRKQQDSGDHSAQKI